MNTKKRKPRNQQMPLPRDTSSGEKLRTAIVMGLASGKGQAAEEVFERLAAKYRRLVCWLSQDCASPPK